MGEFMSIRSLNIAVALSDYLRIPVRVKARVGRRVGAPSRAPEHFYRAPNIVRWGTYYLIERHFKTKVYPAKYVRRRYRKLAWINTIWLLGYNVIFVLFLIDAPRYATNLTLFISLTLGLVVPFLVFEIANGFTLYARHADPLIAWFKNTAVNRDGPGRGELLACAPPLRHGKLCLDFKSGRIKHEF
jgi:hypothetical protein